MEVEAITEMFKNSRKTYNVKYTNYIGDGDSKTYTGIINAAPYNIPISKKVLGTFKNEWEVAYANIKEKRKHLAIKAS